MEGSGGNRKAKLTRRTVDEAKPAETRYLVHDTLLAGFRLVVGPSGKKTFAVRYRTGGGRGGTIREPTIGTFGEITVDQAREIATQWLAAAGIGVDKGAERHAAREAPLMKDLFDRFVAEHVKPHKKASSAVEDERMIRDYLKPTFGRTKVGELTRTEVAKFHAGLAEKPYRANRALAVLSKALNLAELWGMRPDGSNPCRHVKKYPEKARKRFLSPAELGRLGAVLRRAEQGELGPMMPSVIHAVRLLILTGMRSGEVLSLKWDWIDIDAGRINLPDSKTGDKAVPLNAPALAVLNSIPRVDGNPHVIIGGKTGAALVNLKDPWAAIRTEAKLDDVRIHDLRHSFAAIGAGSGASLHIIGGLLGHSQPQTTKRYAHLADDPLREASERIGGRIAGMMEQKQPAVVVDLRKGSRE